MHDESYLVRVEKRHPKRDLVGESEWLEPTERGRLHELHRRITVKDIFGLSEVTFVLVQPVELKLIPASHNYELHAMQTQTSGDGYSHPEGDPKGELIEMRRYQAGDPLRLVLWKVFARSRKLVVRAPEPAIVEHNDMFVYFVSGKDDEASASVARAFLATFDKREHGDLRFSADGANRLVDDEKTGIEDVIDSVSYREHGGEDLLNVAPLVTPSMMTNCFLLVPPKPGNWINLIKEFVGKYQVRPVFILSLKDPLPQKPRATSQKGKWWRNLLLERDQDKEPSQQIHELCAQLEPMGTVRIVDVNTGTARDWKGEI